MAADKKNVEPTMMGNEDLKKMGLNGAKRPPGHTPGDVLHQEGGSSIKRFPIVLAGIAVAAGLATWMYYQSTTAKEDKAVVKKAPE